jgi:hypothetical protein
MRRWRSSIAALHMPISTRRFARWVCEATTRLSVPESMVRMMSSCRKGGVPWRRSAFVFLSCMRHPKVRELAQKAEGCLLLVEIRGKDILHQGLDEWDAALSALLDAMREDLGVPNSHKAESGTAPGESPNPPS